MQIQAILHIPLSKDAYALDEKTLVIRLRTAKDDVDKCAMYFGDRVCQKEEIEVWQLPMEKVASDRYFDYYEGRIESDYTRVCYYFKLTAGEETFFYSEYGFTKEMNCPRTQYFQFPYIRREDIITPPEWAKTMVMYHIFPDSFADGKQKISMSQKTIPLNEGRKSENRNGGNLRGIIENLDYLEQLHINCIYLNPIFLAASYHKYDTIDYYAIDPCFGTMEDFRELVRKCHEKGIRVILDGVFNHCGSGFFAFLDVLKNQEKSQYKDWFYRLQFPVKYETPPNYETFAYVKEMPKLNTGNPEVIKYFCEVGRFWIREADIDGWRLDVANEINHDFWREFRRAVRAEKKDVFLIGEIWEDSSAWLLGDQFDSTMNYSFSYICKEFFADKTIGLKAFDEKINHMNLRYPENVSLTQMNFLDTHDVPRFLSYCDGDVERFKLAVFFMMTAKGIPSVFYGDEKEIMGVKESEYRNPMPWRNVTTKDLEDFFSQLIATRRESMALCKGSYRTLLVDEERQLYAFLRRYQEESVVVLLNYGDKPQEVYLKSTGVAPFVELGEQEESEGRKITCEAMNGKIVEI